MGYYIPTPPPCGFQERPNAESPILQGAVPAVPIRSDGGSSTTQLASSGGLEKNSLRHEELETGFWRKRGGPYESRAHDAVDAICKTPAPKGLVVWLSEHDPALYRKLTRVLPTKISRAWDARVPYERFDALCFELVETYAFAAEQYRAGYEK